MPANKLNIDIRLVDRPDGATVKAIDDLLIAYNEKSLAMKRNAKAVIACDGGEFVGGIYFRWYGAAAIIEYFAVHEKWRGHGVGKQILDGAEQEMRKQGCRWITVDSMSHQAPEFYQGCGYEIIATIPQFFDGYDRMVLRKHLTEGGQG